MADFPAITPSPDSTLEPVNTRACNFAVSGAFRAVDLGAGNGTYRGTVIYHLITAADFATLQAFLETNSGLAVSIDYHDGERYTGRFMDKWSIYRVCAGRYTVSIEFVGEKQ